MKFNKIVMAMSLGAVLVAGAANAADAIKDQGHGTISFTGSIIDAPCSITGDTANQTVDLGEVSNTALTSGEGSSPKTFHIKLEQCDASAIKEGVQVAFTGAPDAQNPEILGIAGTASGAGIVITNGSGTPIKLGELSPAQKLGNGQNTLTFAAYLEKDGASSVVPGDFSSTADFTLTYN